MHGEEKQQALVCDIVENKLENCRIEFVTPPEKPEEKPEESEELAPQYGE